MIRLYAVLFCCLLFLQTNISLVQAQPTGTLLDSSGSVLRGTPLVISGNNEVRVSSNPFATDIATLIKLQDLGFNTVRLCLVDPFFEVQTTYSFWTIEQQLPLIDQVIDNAALVGMNVILNYHSVGEQDGLKNLDMETVNQYWDVLAPRYANQQHVYYEILNEPTFQNNDYLNAQFKTSLTNLYKKVRNLAPQRQILMFSFSGIDFEMQQIIDAYSPDIDWDFTSVAWHAYGANETTLASIETLMTRYRMVCTEWDYPGRFSYVPGELDGFEVHAGALERIGCGWMDWRDWEDTTTDEIESILIPDSILRGYSWNTTVEPPIDPPVEPPTEPPVDEVQLIVQSTDVQVSSVRRNQVEATATVVIVDANGVPVENAEVTIQWGGLLSGTLTSTTDSRGIATFRQTARSRTTGQVTATVINVTASDTPPTDGPVDDEPTSDPEPEPDKPKRGNGKNK